MNLNPMRLLLHKQRTLQALIIAKNTVVSTAIPRFTMDYISSFDIRLEKGNLNLKTIKIIYF
jgi:hypothetical protein